MLKKNIIFLILNIFMRVIKNILILLPILNIVILICLLILKLLSNLQKHAFNSLKIVAIE